MVSTPFGETVKLLFEELELVLGGVAYAGAADTKPGEVFDGVLGAVGFAGDDMRGTVVLFAAVDAWRASSPAGLGADVLTSGQVCDMVGEVSNMVVGGLAKRLLGCGVDVSCSLPTSVCGRIGVPRMPSAAALHVCRHRFDTAAGPVFLHADVLFRDGFAFPTEAADGLRPATVDMFF